MAHKQKPAAPAALAEITRTVMTTREASQALGYAESTMRHWACNGGGPIEPHRMAEGTRLRWKTDDIRRLAGLEPLATTQAKARADAGHAQAQRASAMERDIAKAAELLAGVIHTLRGQSSSAS
jgi:hypothetical protein